MDDYLFQYAKRWFKVQEPYHLKKKGFKNPIWVGYRYPITSKIKPEDSKEKAESSFSNKDEQVSN